MSQDMIAGHDTSRSRGAGDRPQHTRPEGHRRKRTDNQDGKPSVKSRRKAPDHAERLNALPSDEFDTFIPQAMLQVPPTAFADSSFSISHKRADAMIQSDFDDCFALIEETSMQDYRNSSIGWNPKHKRHEMADEDMHYLLVTATTDDSDSGLHLIKESPRKSFAGFMSFMITTDSVPVVPLIYIYEIHLASSSRGRGLGKHLMDLVTQIAAQAGLQMLMLTCFTCNEKARHLYERYGFSVDPTSPEDRRTRGKTIKSDHIIMSKRIATQKD